MANSKCRWECPEQWSEWSEWLAAGLHARNRWRLPVLLVGMLFAGGRRTVTTWLRAAGVSDDFQDYYYFLAALGRKTKSVATQLMVLVLRTLPLPERLLLVIDDSPTKRYGPKVEGADVHHNPTPGPADQPFLYGHVWVTISLALRHPAVGTDWRCRCGRCSTFASKRWPRFPRIASLAAVCHQAPTGGAAGRVARSDPEKSGKNRLDRHRRRLHQAAVPAARFEAPERGRRRSLAQRRGTARPAAEAEEGPTSRSRPAAQVWQEQTQPGQTSRADSVAGKRSIARSTAKPVTKTYKTFLATYRPGRRRDSRRARQGRSWLVRLLLHRSRAERRGDSRSVCRSCHHRTRLPRREGSVGSRPTASSQHLDQPGRVQPESLDAYAGRTLGVEPAVASNLATAATRPGTTPSVALRTPIAAKPCANTSSETNYRRSPPPGRCHEKSSNWPKASWPWPPSKSRFSESEAP